MHNSGSEFQASILVTALRALPEFRTARERIEMLAADTTEGGFLTGVLEKRVVTTIIKEPQAKKQHGYDQKEYDGGGNKIHQSLECPSSGISANRTSRHLLFVGSPGKQKRAEVSFGAS
jgi:hypothetical protein